MRAAVLALLLLASAAGARQRPPEAGEPAGAAPSPAASEDAGVEAWVDRALAAVAQGSFAELDRLLDPDALLDRATAGVGASKSFEKRFRDGARRTLLGPEGPLGALVAVAGGGGEVTFLRGRVRDGAPSALFRLYYGDGQGYDYREFVLERREDALVAVDCYQYSRGETSSRALRRWYVPLAVEKNRSLIQRLIGVEHQLAANWKRVERMIGLYGEGELEEAERLYRGLPTELQRDRSLLLLRIGSTPVEDPAYTQAVTTLIEHHPAEPCTILASIDFHSARRELGQTRAAFEQLRSSVGGDPFLDVLEANVLLAHGELDLAAGLAREAIDGGLGWVDPYWVLLAVSLTRQDHARTLDLLLEVDAGFVVEWQDFAGVPEYAGFVASPYHARWLEHRAGAAAGG